MPEKGIRGWMPKEGATSKDRIDSAGFLEGRGGKTFTAQLHEFSSFKKTIPICKENPEQRLKSN